jgi:predicted O-linked N-acetylglucosamine transferase (SPINDLY family)
VNDAVLKLWARVLQLVPGSRLLLLAPPGETRRRVRCALKVEPGRVDFADFLPRPRYLESYHRIDLGLDTFPYNGHTTSLDALWMGVPVVSRYGLPAVSRAGLSQSSNLGLPELVASTQEEFVRTAVTWAGDLPRLAALRASLRQRLTQSPLMDGDRFARNVEHAYRTIWQAWCEKDRNQVRRS